MTTSDTQKEAPRTIVYRVAVTAPTAAHCDQVISERIYYEEEIPDADGNPFDYQIDLAEGADQPLTHLYDAAPKLLEALRDIVGQKNPNRWGYDAAVIALDDAWREKARAAIAQAEGGE